MGLGHEGIEPYLVWKEKALFVVIRKEFGNAIGVCVHLNPNRRAGRVYLPGKSYYL